MKNLIILRSMIMGIEKPTQSCNQSQVIDEAEHNQNCNLLDFWIYQCLIKCEDINKNTNGEYQDCLEFQVELVS